MNFDIYIGPDGQQYVRPKNNICYNYEFFLRELRQVAGISETMGRAVMGFFGEFLAQAMGDGATLTIDEVGTFAPSLTVNRKNEDAKLSGKVVELSRITFRPHPALKQAARNRMDFHKIKTTVHQRAVKPDKDRRKDILVSLIKKKKFITPSDYLEAVHISRSQAYDDLEDFVNGGVITVLKVGRNKLYSLPEN